MVLDYFLAKLGIGLEESGDGSEETDAEHRRLDQPPEMMLRTRVPRDENAIWSRFKSVEISLRELTLHAADGSSETLTLAGTFDLREEKQTDGSDAVYQLSAPPATYESGELSLELRGYQFQADEAELPLEGFEQSTLDFGGNSFEPESGEEWTLTVVFVASEDEAGGAYVLEPSLQWQLS